jgi:ADP-ribosylglycohydrolase
MIGAIIGDVIGSAYEWNNVKSKEFPLFSHTTDFTDDTVMTIATADKILNGKTYLEVFKKYGRAYPDAGYGGNFLQWLMSSSNEPYFSFGNGSAMRVSPVGFAFDTLEEVLAEAKLSAEVTHNHPEGIKGAQAVAASIFLARTGNSKAEIKDFVEKEFHYNLNRTIDEIRPAYRFNETCQGSVPEAIIAFLESKDFEDAIRTAISIGGDSDTLACITGGIAQAYYKKIPQVIITKTMSYLPEEFISLINLFSNKTGAKL